MIETDIIQGEVRYRDHDHSYAHVHTGKKLTSVSEVIRTIYSVKSWDGVDPQVVENARVRGIAVDRYMAEYIREGQVRIEGESEDIQNRVQAATRIFEEQFCGAPAETQIIVYSLQDGIAGTMDVWVNQEAIVDLKCTYTPEKAWLLQLGAYCSYAAKPPDRAGIIHVNPKVYKTGGVWIPVNVDRCRRYWMKAVEWWKETQTFKVR